MIIGLSGKMGSGKSTAFKVLQDIGGQWCHLVKFAQPLYDIQEFTYDRIKSVYTRPETFVKDRKLLQWVGCEWGRDTISQSLWIDLWKAKAAMYESDAIVVCDDVRFDNEAETIRQLGGVVVQLYGPSRDVDLGIKNHASENGIAGHLIDYVIRNEGTKEEFQDAVRELYQQVRLRD